MVRPLSRQDAEQIARWRYDGPWSAYDFAPDDGLLTGPDYLAVSGSDDGPLVGFCCAGQEALVPGLRIRDGVLDVGVGMHPRWTGRGHGRQFVSVVLQHYADTTSAARFRVVVQSWNQRSLRLTRSVGFVEVGEHVAHQDGRDVTYTVSERAVDPSA